MTKNQLIEKVAKKANLTKSAAADAVNATFDLIVEALLRGEKKVVITGFGTFEVRTRNSRDGRIPGTGQIIRLPMTKTIGLTAGKTVKRLIK